MGKLLISTKGMPQNTWLEYRRRGIGGSDAAAIVGMSPYATAYTVWADKTGRLTEKDDSEAMRLGRDLEDYVASRFTEKTGKKVRKKNAILQHDDHEFIIANIDREVIGEKAGLECKTTSALNLKRFKNGAFPDQYYTQCVHYLAVTGWERWYLAVLALGVGFFVYVIERDEDEIKALEQAEADFWRNHILPDVPPPVDGMKPTGTALGHVFSSADGGECELLCENTVVSYNELKKVKAEIESQIEKLEQEMKAMLGECERGVCGKYEIRWKKTIRQNLSKDLLIEKYPAIELDKICKTTETRRFSVVEKTK